MYRKQKIKQHGGFLAGLFGKSGFETDNQYRKRKQRGGFFGIHGLMEKAAGKKIRKPYETNRQWNKRQRGGFVSANDFQKLINKIDRKTKNIINGEERKKIKTNVEVFIVQKLHSPVLQSLLQQLLL